MVKDEAGARPGRKMIVLERPMRWFAAVEAGARPSRASIKPHQIDRGLRYPYSRRLGCSRRLFCHSPWQLLSALLFTL